MIDADLLAILCCPETRLALTLADAAQLEELNRRIANHELRTADNRLVEKQLDGALLREDGGVAYPIREGVPILLIQEGILVGARRSVSR